MTENELIGKIRELRQIKPRKDWVFLTKSQILGQEEPKFELFPFFKPVYAGLFFILLLISLFEFSQGALPGEPLYLLKRVSEKAQAILVSEEGRPKLDLELASKRLEELNQIVDKNEVKKFAPAINEFQANVSKIAKNLVKSKKIDTETIEKIVKLEEGTGKIENTLSIKILSEETEESLESLKLIYKTQAENLIKDLEGRVLTEEQNGILEKAKDDFEAGNYSEALIKVLDLSQR